jgi:molecular chaperone GrpE
MTTGETGLEPVPGREQGLEEAPDASSLGLDLPADHEEAVGVLIDALATARLAADSYLDDLQRVAAEYENFRKRAARDREEVMARSSQRLVQAMLPVLDSFDQAFVHKAETSGEEMLLAGLQGTFHQLMDLLSKEGVEMIPTLGEPFDPNVHEAVAGGGEGAPRGAPPMRARETPPKRVLRPAMVVVAPVPEEGG